MTFLRTREFFNDFVLSLGIVNLHIIFRDKPCSKIILTKFIVVDTPSTYNINID